MTEQEMATSAVHAKFVYALSDVYDAEQRAAAAQQQMLGQATNPQLRAMLEEHISETTQQIDNLAHAFQLLDTQPGGVTCAAAEGLIQQGQRMLQLFGQDAALRDTVIADAQAKLEHLEIASYQTLLVGAEAMDHRDVMLLLQQNLAQEERMAARVEQSAPMLIRVAMEGEPRKQRDNTHDGRWRHR